MDVLIYLSEFLIPLIVFYIVGFGVLAGRPIFHDFLTGAREGMRTVIDILPTLIGLLTAVGVLRTSGLLDAAATFLEGPFRCLRIPTEIIPIALVRMVSNSAAMGLVLDIFKRYGPDSYLGNMASIMMGCTETVFYTMSVYFMSAGIRKCRWTLWGALTVTGIGVAISIVLAGMMG